MCATVAFWQRYGVTRASIRRRAAAPLALFAAIAIAAAGGSSPWFGRSSSSPAAHPGGPSAVHLEHVELVALRAQNAPLTYRSVGP